MKLSKYRIGHRKPSNFVFAINIIGDIAYIATKTKMLDRLTRNDNRIFSIIHLNDIGADLAAKGEIAVGATEGVDHEEQCQRADCRFEEVGRAGLRQRRVDGQHNLVRLVRKTYHRK